MLCTYCNAPVGPRFIEGYEAPCPRCGAPSPLMGATMGSYRNAQPLPQNKRPSLLPVPYQPGIAVDGPTQQLAIRSPQMTRATARVAPTLHERDAQPPMVGAGLAPALGAFPDAGESIHIPPMYTKPRAIIPPYRIVSGLLSFLIVSALLCSGAIYYANASGKLAFLQHFLGDVPPQNLPFASARSLPDPQLNPDYGPAKAIINSASTASKIDPQAAIALQPNNVFAPGQVIYLTYSVHPKAQGVVVIKWYTDGVLYKTMTSKPIAATKDNIVTNGLVSIQYTQSVEGTVEIYWNDQLAIRLYFVVRCNPLMPGEC